MRCLGLHAVQDWGEGETGGRVLCKPTGSGLEGESVCQRVLDSRTPGSSSSRVSVAPSPLLILQFAWVSHEVTETGLKSVLELSLGRVLRFLFTWVGEQMGTGLASICEHVSLDNRVGLEKFPRSQSQILSRLRV